MPTREQRIRTRIFPGLRTYPRERGGFAALPLILRRAQFLFEPRAWQIYCYILMRTGPEGVAWLTLSEMAWDLDFRSVPKLKPYVDDLVEAGWLVRASTEGRDYYGVPDPSAALRDLVRRGRVPQERLEAINELLEALHQQTLEESDAPTSAASGS